MSCWAVVRVSQDYDSVEGVEFISAYATESEANEFIRITKADEDASVEAYRKYIDDYVDAMEVPDWRVELKSWQQFIKDVGLTGGHIHVGNFTHRLKHNLKAGLTYNLPGFSPPPYHRRGFNLFAVEIHGAIVS